MNWQTTLLVLLVVLWAVAQYGLAAHALLDLRRRPTVRGNNKVVWALVILGIPIAGPLVYTVYGPTSFIRRGPQPLPSGPDSPPKELLSPDVSGSPRHESRIARSATRVRQHNQPNNQLPEIPELADLAGEIGDVSPEPAPHRSGDHRNRLARRKVRR
jgi:hypothetical protein